MHACIRQRFNERTLGEDKKKVDVEQLLLALEHLENKNNEILLDFLKKKTFKSEIDEQDVSELKGLLLDFIRKTVVVKNERKLDYLRELFKFNFPLEIYSVNYDTCIEQLSHINYVKYTDGFDIYWNPDNFRDDKFNVKLFKLHGSIIWYESITKEYLKIPVRAFIDDEPIILRLITGEDVNPLLIYPMQKWVYIEPLTELQLMFKKRLIENDTKFLVVVGYSFRDDYIVRMLWDAARRNEKLHIILVDPDAQNLFKNRIKFLDREKTTASRIAERVNCLPYPFSKIIYFLKNDYLHSLDYCIRMEEAFVNLEKTDGQHIEWWKLLRECIECEFSVKGELVLEEKMGKEWLEPSFWDGISNVPALRERVSLCWKALLHSTIAGDEFEAKWLERINKLFEFTNLENLHVRNLSRVSFSLSFIVDNEPRPFNDVLRILEKMDDEFKRKIALLSEKFREKLDRVIESYERINDFKEYLGQLDGNVKWEKYYHLRKSLKRPLEEEFNKLDVDSPMSKECKENITKMILNKESEKLREIFKGETFTFHLMHAPRRPSSHQT